MDGVPGLGAGEIAPGGSTVYEFDALPAGLHLYHCHVRPLAEHIAKGLYGAFIVDPKEGREDADEIVMVMNGFDTNFDRANEFYAANTIGFAYMDEPIVTRSATSWCASTWSTSSSTTSSTRSTCTATSSTTSRPAPAKQPSELTDTVMLCQGQRGILEWRFPHPGRYMFHAHQSEFTELGWQGFFEVERDALVCDPRDDRVDAATGARLAPPAAGVGARPRAAAADRRRARRVRGAGRARPRRAARSAGRGARGREDGAASRATIELTVRNDGPDAVSIAQAQVNDAFVQFTGAERPIGQLATATVAPRAAVDRGRGLRGRAGHLDGRDDRARDPGRGRDAGHQRSASSG